MQNRREGRSKAITTPSFWNPPPTFPSNLHLFSTFKFYLMVKSFDLSQRYGLQERVVGGVHLHTFLRTHHFPPQSFYLSTWNSILASHFSTHFLHPSLLSSSSYPNLQALAPGEWVSPRQKSSSRLWWKSPSRLVSLDGYPSH